MIKKIDETTCINCRLCEYFCPMDVFRCKEEKVYIAYIGDCCNCWQCRRICPVNAIVLDENSFPKKYDGGERWRRVKKMMGYAE